MAKKSFLGHFWPNLGQKLGFWCLTPSQFPGWWLVQIWLCLLFCEPQVHIRGCIFHFFEKLCLRPAEAHTSPLKMVQNAKIGISVPHAVSISWLMVGQNLVMFAVLWTPSTCQGVYFSHFRKIVSEAHYKSSENGPERLSTEVEPVQWACYYTIIAYSHLSQSLHETWQKC